MNFSDRKGSCWHRKKGKFVCLKLLLSVELNRTSKPFSHKKLFLRKKNTFLITTKLVQIGPKTTVFRRLFFPLNFWGTFLSYFTKKLGEKCPKTFGFDQPPFSTQKSKIVGAQKVPQLLGWPVPPPPPMENTQIEAAFFLELP